MMGLDGVELVLAMEEAFGFESGVVSGLVLALIFGIFAVRLTRPFQVFIPSRIRSVRDLIQYVITSENIAWTREQVRARVKQIITEQLAINEAEYTENSTIKT